MHRPQLVYLWACDHGEATHNHPSLPPRDKVSTGDVSNPVRFLKCNDCPNPRHVRLWPQQADSRGNPKLLQQGAIRCDGATPYDKRFLRPPYSEPTVVGGTVRSSASEESIHTASSFCAKESSENFAVRTFNEREAFQFHPFPQVRRRYHIRIPVR